MIIYLLNILALLAFVPSINQRINELMYWKVFFEILALSIAGILLGLKCDEKNVIIKKWVKNSEIMNPKGITSILVFIGTLTFWMFPRSLDLAVSDNSINYLMLLSIYFSGIYLGTSLNQMSFVLKTAIIIYGLAMVLATGTVYLSNNTLLCAVYNIEMQKTTGEYLLKLFPFLYIIFLFRVYTNLKKMKVNDDMIK